MKLQKVTLENKDAGQVALPAQFSEDLRPDLVKRAVLAVQANKRQPYGPDIAAGMKHSAELSRRRRNYRGSYGYGISRVPRKIHSRNGTRMGWEGAEVSHVVGGRAAHPPLVEKTLKQKINIKERRKAIRSAIAASVMKELAVKRGHKVPDKYPFVIENKVEELKTTKEIAGAFAKLDLNKELDRVSDTKIRAGIGKMRGRRVRKKVGPLIVVSKTCPLKKSARNLPGVDVTIVDKLNAELLAPGTVPGRLTLWTEGALERLEKEKLFC